MIYPDHVSRRVHSAGCPAEFSELRVRQNRFTAAGKRLLKDRYGDRAKVSPDSVPAAVRASQVA
jgi:hypothetical protein